MEQVYICTSVATCQPTILGRLLSQSDCDVWEIIDKTLHGEIGGSFESYGVTVWFEGETIRVRFRMEGWDDALIGRVKTIAKEANLDIRHGTEWHLLVWDQPYRGSGTQHQPYPMNKAVVKAVRQLYRKARA